MGAIPDTGKGIFGRSYAAEPDLLIEQLREDEAIAAADNLLLTIRHSWASSTTRTRSSRS